MKPHIPLFPRFSRAARTTAAPSRPLLPRLLPWLLLLPAGLPAAAQITKAPRPYVEFTVLADRADCRYPAGEKPELTVVAKAGGNALDGVEIAFEAGDDRMAPDLRGKSYFRNGRATVPVGGLDRPGFRYCTVRFEVEGERYAETVKTGFDLRRLQPTIPDPPGFDRFWRNTLDEARRTPLDVAVVPAPDRSTERVETFAVRIPVFGEGSCICGWLSVPRDGKRHPALLVPPGAGVKRIAPATAYAEEGFLTLAIEIHGLPMELPDSLLQAARERIGDYWYAGIESCDDYYYRRVYAGCVRAVDYLLTRPEFDGEHLGVTGGSQGGALAIVTAALHPEVDFVAAFYPALCDVSGYLHGRAGGWPRMFADAGAQPGIDRRQAMRTMARYDVANFARRLRCPGFFSYGFNDDTCPPTSVAAALNVVTVPKTIVTTPSSRHWRFPETNRRATQWMRERAGLAPQHP